MKNILFATTFSFLCLSVKAQEPQANSKDTTYIVDKLFGKEKIVEFENDLYGGYKLVTEIAGEDGNDHKKTKIETYLSLKI